MKKQWYLIAAVIIGISCKKSGFLEKTVVTDLNENSVFRDSSRSVDFLTGIYADVSVSFNPERFGNAGLEAATDEAESPLNSSNGNAYLQWATGAINQASVTTGVYSTCYSNIRRVNQLFAHLPIIPWGTAQKQQAAAEARFLRAWYYSLLVKHYGGVPLVGDTIYGSNTTIPAVRSTYKQCVDYILSECDAAAAVLPIEHPAVNYGRITRGACLALKSRVLLYAASPLFNGNGITTDEPLRSLTGYPAADANRWKQAADAAKAVMDMNKYVLNEDNTTRPGYGFYRLFLTRFNTEYIFPGMLGQNRILESRWEPPSRSGAGGSRAYQGLAEAFPMKNGKAITDPTSGYNAADPYANRDPRFNYTIMHNGSGMIDGYNPGTIFTYVGAPRGDGIYAGTSTGYYNFKMVDTNTSNNANLNQTERCWPLIRHAEILLNYAEATNEFSGPSADVYAAIELIRKRAGLVPYQLPTGLTKDQMRDAIRNERRIELAFEEHRFWDVRRWKIAETTENKMMTGMEITRQSNGTYTYKVVDVRQHAFRPAMYLWPFPQAELGKSPELLQNPLW